MESLAKISSDILHQLTLQASKTEKSATFQLLEHLAEIDRRRLYAEKGFPSLWVYVNEFLGYSESQTSERVSAMRLMMKVPEVKKELEEGKISLTSTAKLATHVRREKSGTKETLELLSAISGKATREVDQYLAQKATVEFHMEKFKAITSETTRIIIDVDQEFLTLMNRVRELKGHPGSSTQELMKIAMQNLIKKNEVKVTEKKNNSSEIKHDNLLSPNTSTLSLRAREGELNPSRYISQQIRNEIRIRSRDQCEYIESSSGKRCPCKTKLEFDHIIPFAMGGQSTLENLRHYCPAHNQLSAIRHFGFQHMSRFLKN
jgi:hypothetical protein